VGGVMLARTVGEQGEAEACKLPLLWEADDDDFGRATTPVAICGRVQVIPAMSSTQVCVEIAQPAKAAETAAPSQTGRDIPAGKDIQDVGRCGGKRNR
jgi:hypothetical protein